MMNIDLEYICTLFFYTQRFYEIYEEKRNLLYLKFVKLKKKKNLIHETTLKIPYWAFNSLLIVDHFQVP